ncbi:MAG: glycosyltransferase family 4 protein [Alphaproteobacteria bacterium]
MRILTFTTLYPNAAQPHHGVFVENRLRHLVAGGEVSARVVAPVPWFPFRSSRFGRYADFARAPRRERRHGLVVDHPRYPAIPKIGMNAAPFLLYLATRRAARGLIAAGHDFDLIDAHYFYPDGVAAALLGRSLGKPVTITARGTDLNLIPRHALPRRMIRWAADEAAGLVTVCQALKDRLAGLGVAAERVTVLRNGVDLDLFRPGDRATARAEFGFDGVTLLSVGNLVPLKGHNLVIAALSSLPQARLLIAGGGPDRPALEALAIRLGVADRVRFLGRVGHEELPRIYGTADALVLASSREGWPNVLLEAMACGTPVVATEVGGIPEVVATPAAGVLMPERSAEGVAAGVEALFASPPERAATRAYAEGFGWEATTQGQIALFRSILGSREHKHS